MRVRGQVRGLIAFLVEKDYRLLGCESPLGPLPDDEIARQHRAAVHDAIKNHQRLDSLTIYQPIRWEEEFGKRLLIRGVEDPELYEGDRETLMELRKLARAMRRATKAERALLRKKRAELTGKISSRAHGRGQVAARNLLLLMKEQGLRSAVLVLGGGHALGALEELAEHRLSIHVVEPHSYKERTSSDSTTSNVGH